MTARERVNNTITDTTTRKNIGVFLPTPSIRKLTNINEKDKTNIE